MTDYVHLSVSELPNCLRICSADVRAISVSLQTASGTDVVVLNVTFSCSTGQNIVSRRSSQSQKDDERLESWRGEYSGGGPVRGATSRGSRCFCHAVHNTFSSSVETWMTCIIRLIATGFISQVSFWTAIPSLRRTPTFVSHRSL